MLLRRINALWRFMKITPAVNWIQQHRGPVPSKSFILTLNLRYAQ